MAKSEKWGIIAHEYVVSLFPVFMLVDGLQAKITKALVHQGVDMAEVIEKQATTHTYKPSNWQTAHEQLVHKIKKDVRILRNAYRDIDSYGRALRQLAQGYSQLPLAKLSTTRLDSVYQNYCRRNTDFYAVGLILPLLDFQKTTFLTDEVMLFLKKKRAIKYFSILTTPLQDTYNKKHELELMDILEKILAHRELVKIFKTKDGLDIRTHIQAQYSVIWRMIRRHTLRYAWVHYVYQGPAADETYFIDILRDFVRRHIQPAQARRQHQTEKKNLILKQKQILKFLKPDPYYRNLILLARDAVYYKIYRRDLQTASYYYMEPVLREIGRRLSLSLSQVRMMLPDEVAHSLRTGKVDATELNQRLKLVVYARTGTRRLLLTGKQATSFIHNIEQEKINTNVKEIIGTTAQPGKVVGVVKVINTPEEMSKMKPGDILVSGATNPNLMPAIRQAAAIVTDEGGLTCHAAIVSREFKIPCVVGTGFVSRILKDGDMAEIDATRGIIKKI